MKLVHYNPFNDLSLFKETFNDFFNDYAPASSTNKIWNPPVNIMEQENSVLLTIELPGLGKEDIAIDVQGNTLTIKGERKEEKLGTYYRKERNFGKFQRAFTLSEDIITDDVNAKLSEGILTVILKKGKSKESIKQISIH